MARRGNTDNLKPVRTSEEAKERGRNGGKKSGQVRASKKSMREAAKMLLDMPIVAPNVKKQMKQLGFEEEDLNNRMAMLVSILKSAMSGDVRAAQFFRDTVGDGHASLMAEQHMEMEKKQYELEKQKFEMQSGIMNEDSMPTIINIRPDDCNEQY